MEDPKGNNSGHFDACCCRKMQDSIRINRKDLHSAESCMLYPIPEQSLVFFIFIFLIFAAVTAVVVAVAVAASVVVVAVVVVVVEGIW